MIKPANKFLKDYCKSCKDLYEDAPTGIIVLDPKGSIRYINKYILDKTGLSKKDIQEKKFSDLGLINSEEKKRLAELFSRAVNGKKSKPFEITWRSADKNIHHSIVSYSFIKEGNEIKGVMGIVNDITDKKKLESYLYEDIERFKKITDLSNEGIVIHDGRKIIDINKTLLRLLGEKKEDVLGKDISNFIEKDHVHKVKKKISEGYEGAYEIKVKKSDGTVIPLEIETRNINNNKKLRIALFKNSQNIKVLESQLLNEIEGSSSYLDVASFIVIVLNREGKVELINKRGCEVLGFEDESEILGRDWFEDFIPAERKKEVKKIFKDILKGKISSNSIKQDYISAKDNTKRIIKWTNKAIKGSDGSVIGTLSSGEDVTERVARDIKIKESESKYRTLVDNIYEGVWQIDKEAKTVFANDRLAEMLGYSVDEMAGKHLFDFMDDKNKKMAAELFEKRKRGLKETHEFSFIKKDKTKVITRLDTSPVTDEKGKFSGAIAYVSDITDEVEARNAMLEEKARTDALLSNSPDIVLELDEDGNILFINKKTLISSAKSKKSKNIFDILHRDNKVRVKKEIDKVIKTCEPRTTVLPYLFKDHGGKWFECRFSPIMSANKATTLMLIVTDITERYETEEQLKRSQRDLALAQEAAHIGTWVLDPDTKQVKWSKEIYKIFGIDARKKAPDFPNGHIPMIHPGDMRPLEKWLDEAVKKGRGDDFYLRIITKAGEQKILEVICNAEKIEDGKVRLVGTAQDVTELKKAEKELQEKEKNLRLLVENQTDFLIKTDSKGRYLYVSPSFAKFLGKKVDELIGKDSFEFVILQDRKKTRKQMKRIFESPFEAALRQRIRTDDGIKWVSWGVKAVTRGGEAKEIVATGKNITKTVEYEERLKYLSFHDNLTGLYNRVYFEEEMKRLDTDRNLPISIIIGDVNSLKLVNDTFGHKRGDKLLKEISKILTKVCRSDDILARWGGDEFSILLPKTDRQISEKIVNRIHDACRQVKDLDIPLSISLGVATKEKMKQDIIKILGDAEANMYRHKLTERKSVTSSIISSLTRSLWEKSDETEEHSNRLQGLSSKLGRKLELSQSEIDRLRLLALLHDIGKIAVPDNILFKEAELNKDDWKEIEKHSEIGYNICDSSPLLSHISEEVLHHHTRYDGKGYPKGIKGKHIPLLSRILTIVDAYDVLINGRHYQNPVDKNTALKEIEKCSGTQFDPEISRTFIDIVKNGE